MLMQHFYLGLRQSSAQFLDLASKGAFLHLPISEGRVVLATILDNTPYTDDHSDALEEDCWAFLMSLPKVDLVF